MQQIAVSLVDDMDSKSAAVETVHLAFRDRTVEIDLSQRNIDRLEGFLTPFIEHGRRVTGRRQRTRRRPVGSPDPSAVREWAKKHNIELSPRGRVPTAVMERYHAANK